MAAPSLTPSRVVAHEVMDVEPDAIAYVPRRQLVEALEGGAFDRVGRLDACARVLPRHAQPRVHRHAVERRELGVARGKIHRDRECAPPILAAPRAEFAQPDFAPSNDRPPVRR